MTNHSYQQLLQQALDGKPVTRHDTLTIELPCNVTWWDLYDPVVTIPERGLNYTFMFAEALWILRGRSELSELSYYCDNMRKYSDDGMHMSGAYGPMYVSQLRYVVDTLLEDLFTRQAVMTFWRPNPRPSKDIPCTVSLQFIVDPQFRLDVVANMRSSDVFLGVPYDVFSFSMTAYHVLLWLRLRAPTLSLQLGRLCLMTSSQHLYARDVIKCPTIIKSQNVRTYRPIYDPTILHPTGLENKLESLRNHPEQLWV